MSIGLHPIGLVPVGLMAATGTAPPGDTEAPTWTGPITVGAKTSSTIALTLPTASDNVGVSRYEYRVGGGAWVNNGTSTAVALSGLAALTSYTIDARALDAADNSSTVLSATTSTYRAGATGADILANTGPVGSSPAGILYDDVEPGDESKWFSFYIVTPPASGTLTANPDGSFTFVGAASTFFTYQLEVDGVAVGSPQTVSLYGATIEVGVSGQGGTVKAGAGAVSVDLLSLGVTATVAGNGATLKAGTGAVSVDMIAVPPSTVTVQAAGIGATVKDGYGAVSIIVIPMLPTVTAMASGTGLNSKAGFGSVSIIEYIPPIAPETSMFISVAEPTTYLSIAGR